MRLFVAENGDYQGWLAALLCCCAALNEDEYPSERERERERERSRPSTHVGICNEQPSTTALPTIPTKQPQVVFKGDEVILEDRRPSHDRKRRSSIPTLRPLEMGGSSLLGRRPSKHADAAKSHVKRPSIGAPNSFRRLDYSEAQRASLVPLKLGPVVLAPDPLPNDLSSQTHPATKHNNRGRSDSTQALLRDSKYDYVDVTRESSFQHSSRRNSDMLFGSPPFNKLAVPMAEQRLEKGVSLSSHTRQPSETASSRPSTEVQKSGRLRRKRSNQSSKGTAPQNDADAALDQEVLELNTIVEERRAEALRSATPDRHIPAVAPGLHLGARSDLLNEIGSAFSRPLIAREPSRQNLDETLRPDTQTKRPSISRNSSRVSGWLSGILQSTPNLVSNEPFYKCNMPASLSMPARPLSQASLYSTELASPSLTIASSPTTSKGHSRSITADSRLTPLLPPAMGNLYGPAAVSDLEHKREGHPDGDAWPVLLASTSQVGLAI